MRTAARFATAAAAAWLAAGCAAAPARKPEAPRKGVLLEVPFYPDETDQCGPSALAGVLSYWGDEAGPAALKELIYRSSLRGALTVDLYLAARSRGLDAEMVNGDRARVRGELDAGRPLIVFVNRGFLSAPIGHYMVVTGYDDEGIFANTGGERNARMSWPRFERQWDKTERWALLIAPGGRS